MYELEEGADIGLPSELTDDEKTRTVPEPLQHSRVFTGNEPGKATMPVEHSTTAASVSELPQASEEIPGKSSARTAVHAADAQYDILLGATRSSPQYGILGEVAGRKIALDLNETHTISLFGVQGGGKSYTLGAIAEMAALAIPQLNVLPHPLATIIFHYSPTQDYRPEFTSMVAPNDEEGQLQALRERYGAAPQALRDLVLLSPQSKVEARRAEYPDIAIYPFKVCGVRAASESLAISDGGCWKPVDIHSAAQSDYERTSPRFIA